MSSASTPASSPATFVPLLGARAGVMVEVTPGKPAVLHEPQPLDPQCIADLVPIGGGTYRVVPRLATTWLRFSQASLRKLGIGISENTMQRLGRAKFIQVRQISPSCYEFNYQSWLAHTAAVEADPEFWDTEIMTAAGKRTRRVHYQEGL